MYNADVSTFPPSARRCIAFVSVALWKIGEKISLVYAYTSREICCDDVYFSAMGAIPARGSLDTEELASCMRLDSDGIIT